MITGAGNPVFDLIKTLTIESGGRVLSGCSTNACLALSKLGEKTALVGRVGNDFDQFFRTEMSRFGIEYEIEKSEESGGFSLIYHDEQGNRSLDLLGDAGKISEFPDKFLDSEWIIFGPILKEVDLEYVKKVKAKSKAKIFTDPQGFLRNCENNVIHHEKTSEIEEVASLSDIFKPNEMECHVLSGIDPRVDYQTPAKLFKSWGAGLVIITLAEQGSVIYDGKDFYRIPPYVTEAKDPTGAGDTYLAGFIYGLKQGYDYYEAGCLASCVSSVMIENCGPDFPLTVEKVMSRKDELLKKPRMKV